MDQDDDTQSSSCQQQDWMYLPQLPQNSNIKENISEEVLDPLNKAYTKYTTDHINAMPFWIENQVQRYFNVKWKIKTYIRYSQLAFSWEWK